MTDPTPISDGRGPEPEPKPHVGGGGGAGGFIPMLRTESGRHTLDIARVAHEASRAYCITLGDNSQLPWDEAPAWQRESVIAGVQFIADDPRRSPVDSHISWCDHKYATGWTYGPVKDEVAKTHPCLRPYHELPEEQRRKDALFVAIVRALLAQEGPHGER